jgi:hypothetical protein
VTQAGGAVNHRVGAVFIPAVAAFPRLLRVVFQAREVCIKRLGDDAFDVGQQMFLVVLHRQDVVAALIPNLLGDGLLAAHGIDGRQRAAQVEQFQQGGNGRDFVGFGVDGYLAQRQTLACGPRTDQMERPELGRARTTQRFAVDGRVLDPQSLLDRLHPVPEADLERLRLEPVEDALEGVMRGDAVGQLQETLQPVATLAAERLDVLPVLGAGDDGAEGDDEDVLQPM